MANICPYNLEINKDKQISRAVKNCWIYEQLVHTLNLSYTVLMVSQWGIVMSYVKATMKNLQILISNDKCFYYMVRPVMHRKSVTMFAFQ